MLSCQESHEVLPMKNVECPGSPVTNSPIRIRVATIPGLFTCSLTEFVDIRFGYVARFCLLQTFWDLPMVVFAQMSNCHLLSKFRDQSTKIAIYTKASLFELSLGDGTKLTVFNESLLN